MNAAPFANALLLDTNILSYIHRGDPLAQRYLPHMQGQTLLIAAQTVGELRYGMFLARWGERRSAELERLLSLYTVIYPTDGVCTRWARVRADARHLGRPIDDADAWIAATALELGVPILTHNRADFDMLERLRIISENPT